MGNEESCCTANPCKGTENIDNKDGGRESRSGKHASRRADLFGGTNQSGKDEKNGWPVEEVTRDGDGVSSSQEPQLNAYDMFQNNSESLQRQLGGLGGDIGGGGDIPRMGSAFPHNYQPQ